MRTLPTMALLACLAAASPLVAQTDTESCPLHAQHMAAAHDPAAALDHRGDQVMGFEHTRTTHHFLLAKDGGAIHAFLRAQIEDHRTGDPLTVPSSSEPR